ncbi:YbfB/YjiJ family MFS transporter [Affinibrenneria salicis]|uniref:YbfB/YjiJ family MFS transporter n=1 Tax=Affinibrenneria salicis TaxID=2590031 RepID=A0A5J5FQM4_9GAMM|nr:YbfB/YjiJ family MFS transporter [Affinibrenneria salicis]KAA8995282.1 YbfB/YjiJ family MFS transporter [Affinibrenneria salicis]
MSVTPSDSVRAPAIAVTGFVVLVVAMGIGRFAFTPQLPLMIAEHQLTLTSAGLVASMNYLGYLLGAWDAMRARRFVVLRLWASLAGAIVLTLLSAALEGPWWHGLLRFALGWTSAWSLVLIAAWSSERLAHCGRPALGAAVFAGPGAGIAISGLLAPALSALAFSAAQAWLVYGALALALTLLVCRYLPRGQAHAASDSPSPPLHLSPAMKRLVISYSLAGFGYILPATFLSQMAAARFPASLLAQFVWPVFGAASVLGILLGIVTRHYLSASHRLALTLWGQAAGVLAALLLPGIGGLALGALLIGGGFLNVVQLALQCGRELAAQHGRYMAGLLTTGYAIGQLAGPLLSAISSWLTRQLEPALYVAFLCLILAGLFVWPRK